MQNEPLTLCVLVNIVLYCIYVCRIWYCVGRGQGSEVQKIMSMLEERKRDGDSETEKQGLRCGVSCIQLSLRQVLWVSSTCYQCLDDSHTPSISSRHSLSFSCWMYMSCVQVYTSWWGLKPEYTQTHGDLCHGGDLNWGPHGYKSL